MAKLLKLPSEVANLVRSGTVAPTFVRCVEELILNSIDAEATKVTLKINFEDYDLQIVDDGYGIGKEDLELVGERHYTSKARTKNDLNNLQTYGYRGEALASLIGCSTTVEICSKVNFRSHVYSKKFKSGAASSVRRGPEGKISNRGCVVHVKGLLSHCPVRQNRIDKNLLKQELVQMVEHLNLINPKLSINIRDDRTGASLFHSLPDRSLQDAFARICEKRNVIRRHERLMELKDYMDCIDIAALISPDSHHNRNMQFLFVNKRYIPKSRIYKLFEDHLSSVLGFGSRRSTSSKDSQDLFDHRLAKKNSPKAGANTAEAYAVFLVNITCPWTECLLTLEDNKNKVSFQNLDTLAAAVQTFTLKFKRIFQPTQKLVHPPKVGASLMRNNTMSRTERCSSKEKEALTAMKVGESLSLHDMKGSVHSKPAIRVRNDGDQIPLLNKPLAESNGTDDEFDSPNIRCDESDDSTEPFISQGSYCRATKSRLQDKKKPTTRLSKTYTHNIRGLKKRKQARDSSAQFGQIEVNRKKPRLTVPYQILDNSRRNSSDGNQNHPSNAPFLPEADDTVFVTSQSKRNQSRVDDYQKAGSDIEVCDRMSTLSVSTYSHYTESAPKTDPRPPFQTSKQESKLPSPLSVYDTILPVVSNLNERLGVPDYATNIAKYISDRFYAQGSEFSRTFPQHLQQLCADSTPTNAFVTPENNRLRLERTITTRQPILSKKPIILESNLQCRYTLADTRTSSSRGAEVVKHQAPQNIPRLSKPRHVSCASRNQESDESAYFTQGAHKYDHRENVDMPNLTIHAGVTLRPRAHESEHSSTKSEKRHGKVFSSQEFPHGVVAPDSPMGDFQGNFTDVLPAAADSYNAQEHNDTRVGDWIQKVVPGGEDIRTPSAVFNLRFLDPSRANPRRISNDGGSDFKAASLGSSAEDHSQNVVSFSQNYPEFIRSNHRRESARISEFEEELREGTGNFYRNFSQQQSDSHHKRRLDFGENPNSGNFHAFADVNPEVPRRDGSLAHYFSETSLVHDSLFESSTHQEASKYFQRNSGCEQVKDGINLELPEKTCGPDVFSSIGLTPMTPVAEKLLPEINFIDMPAIGSGYEDKNITEIDLIHPLDEEALRGQMEAKNGLNSDKEEAETQEQHNGVGTSPLAITETSGFVAAGEAIAVACNTADKNMLQEENRNVETILLNKQASPNFRNAWLKKVFPEGAKKDWKLDDTFNKKVKSVGSLNQLNHTESRLAETVRSCFAEACDDDLIMDKWDATSWIAATTAPLKSSEDFGSHQSGFRTEMSLGNMKSREIQLWSKKSIQDTQISCRFTKQDLGRTLVVGQVDGKFIAAKIAVDNKSAENSKKKQVLVLFDQHAVHERIRLEKLISESQQEIEGVKGIAFVDVSPPMLLNFADTEVRVMNNFKTSFASIGVTVEVCGPYAVKISTAPTCFVKKISNMVRASRQEAIEQLVRNVIQEQVQNIIQTNGSPQPIPKTVMEVLKSAACKGAYKFGDQLSFQSCVELIENLKSCKVPFQCAHGRPVLVALSNL